MGDGECVEVEEEPKHFTYSRPSGDLQQGDILELSSLEKAMEEESSVGCFDDTRWLLVVTQSCDLVRRSAPKAEYIALAPTRPLFVHPWGRAAQETGGRYTRATGECLANEPPRRPAAISHQSDEQQQSRVLLRSRRTFV